jgi:8-oxo-dGTP pyrophosphatase MutT (NUDIX family)
MPRVTGPAVEARPAASAILLRESRSGFEVLVVMRPPRGFFGGLTVFPGGAVDAEDDSDLARLVVPGDQADHPHRVAALRELAEETGIALTRHGPIPAPEGGGEPTLEAMRATGVELDSGGLTLVSRWVTPEYAPKRYDTRFYLARVDDPPEVRLDHAELVGHAWVTPSAALSRHEAGDWDMFLPTVAHLRWLRRRASVEDAISSAQGADGRSLIKPRRMEDGSLVPILMPVDQR